MRDLTISLTLALSACFTAGVIVGFSVPRTTNTPTTMPKAVQTTKESRRALIKAGATGEIIELYCGDAGTDYEADVCERAGYEFQDENERAGAVPELHKLSI